MQTHHASYCLHSKQISLTALNHCISCFQERVWTTVRLAFVFPLFRDQCSFISWYTSPTYQDYPRDINTVILTLDTATTAQQLATCPRTNTMLLIADPRVALITCFWPASHLWILYWFCSWGAGSSQASLKSCCGVALGAAGMLISRIMHACMTPVTYIKMQGLGALIRGDTSTWCT